MEKEFVEYTEALALKELGFDEPCLGYYAADILCTGQPREIQLDEDRNYKKSKTESFPIIVAPTYSQAFRWFRDNHTLEASIVFHEAYFYKGKTNVYESIIEKRGGESYLSTPIEGFFTYEEAELACIKKLIKIVGIVKEK